MLSIRGGSTRFKITWVQQRQHHRAHESARERVLSLTLWSAREIASEALSAERERCTQNNVFHNIQNQDTQDI